MTAKQVLILIDDFSSNSVDAYDNVTLYDFGTFNKFREWDYYLNNNFTIDGYGDVDYVEPLTANTNPGFYQVAYDDKAEWAVGLDRDYAFNSGTGLGLGYYTAYWQDYYYFLSENSSSDVNIQHGDWSLYALESQLDDPSDVEIILIDVDSVDLSGQLSALFDIVPSIYSSTGYSTNIEYILNSWLNIRGAYDSTSYIPTTLSISISGGLPDLGTTLSLGYLASLDVALVQAAPNVNQGQYDWGSVYSNVINVGAWNVDQSGEPLWSSLPTLNTLDILANGYVENSAWGSGWNFGTSFATPRVSAEIINTYAIILDAIAAGIASGEITQEDIANSPDISYQDLMDFLVNVIGTEIYIELNDFWFDSPVLVLSDDVATSPNPVTPPLTIADGVGMSGYTLTGASFSAGSNNSAPSTTPATNSGNEDTPVTGTLTGTDADQDVLTYALVTDAAHGSVTIDLDTGAYTYTPSPDFNGTDSFTFKVNDGTVDSAAATVTLTVAAVNDAPLATPATGSGNEDADATGTLVASDVDQDTLKYFLVDQAAHGTVAINETTGAYTYTPAPDFNGTDSFTFKVNDGTVDSAAATVRLTVAAVNDAPLATPATGSGNEDTPVTGTLKGTDADQDVLTYALVTDASNGSVTIDANSGDYTYTPSLNYFGSDSFTFKVNDGTLDSAVATVALTVDAVNDKPLAVAASGAGVEDTDITGKLAGTDVDQDTLTFELAGNPRHGQVFIESNGDYIYTPFANFHGSDSFSFRVNDGAVDSEAAKVSVSVAEINDVPVAFATTISTQEDTPYIGVLEGEDIESGSAESPFKLIAGSELIATLDVASMDAVEYGTDSSETTFTNAAAFEIIYQGGANFSFDIDALLMGFALGSVVKGVAVELVGNDTDTPTGFVMALVDSWSSATEVYIIAQHVAGKWAVGDKVATVYFDLADGEEGYVVEPIFAEIETLDGEISGPVGAPLAVSIGVNDALTYTLVTGPTHGSVVINGNGGYSYTPDADFTGDDTFTFSVNDGLVDSDPAIVKVSVASVDDPASGTLTVTGAVQEGSTLSAAIDDLADVDGSPVLTYQWQDSGDGTNWNNINGAVDASYDIASSQAEVGSYLRVVVTSTDALEGTTEFISTGAQVTNVDDEASGTLSIAGNFEEGATLSVAVPDLVDEDGTTTLTYQWQRSSDAEVWNDVAGAIGASYGIASDQTEVGSYLRVVVTSTDVLGGTTEFVSSGEQVVNVNDEPLASPLSVSTAEDTSVSGLLTGFDADSDDLTFTLVDDVGHGVVTLGANGGYSYTPDANFNGTDTFRFKVNDGTVDSPASEVSITVRPVNDGPTGGVLVEGDAVLGSTLTANPLLADEDGLGDLIYQWRADGEDIVGATESTLLLEASEVSKQISLAVAYLDGGGTIENVESLPTVAVTEPYLVTVSPKNWSDDTQLTGVDVWAYSVGEMSTDLLSAEVAVYRPTSSFSIDLYSSSTVDVGSLQFSLGGEGVPEDLEFSPADALQQWVVTPSKSTAGTKYVAYSNAPQDLSSYVQAGELIGTLTGTIQDTASSDWLVLSDVEVGLATDSKSLSIGAYETSAHSVAGGYKPEILEAGQYAIFADLTDTSQFASDITASDAFEVLKMAMHLSTQQTDPWAIIAADVNQDGRVSSFDAYMTSLIAAGSSEAQAQRMVFVDPGADLTGVELRNASVELGAVVNAELDKDTTVDLVGVLLGDLNHQVIAS